ncbi:MAG TPA: hypothetical protein VGM25_09345 [Caulobacteraceae bacterium]|jgi:hypothetical protein
MTSKLLAGCAAVLALSFGAGQALAQSASANAGAEAGAGARGPVDVSVGGQGSTRAPRGDVGAASAETERKTRQDEDATRNEQARHHGNVVTSTLKGVPGLVGSTVGGGLSQAGSTIGGTVGGALGVGRH